MKEIISDPVGTVFNHRIFENPGFDPEYAKDARLNGSNYAVRAYVLTRPGDIFLHAPGLERYVEFQKEHFEAVGYGPTTQTTVGNDNREAVLEYPDHAVSIYYPDAAWAQVLVQHSPDQAEAIWRRVKATKTIDDKNCFVPWLKDLGLDGSVPRTKLYEADTPRTFKDAPLPGYIKAALASNGFKNSHVTTWRQAAMRARTMERFQIQQEIPHDLSQSAQYYAMGQKIVRSLVTDTMVNPDGSHAGNLVPATHDSSPIADPIALAAAELGVEGYYGLDILLARNGLVYVIEGNPRPTGCSYGWEIANRLGIKQWRSRIIDIKFTDPFKIDLESIKYDKRDRAGLIVVSSGQLPLGKVELWIAGDEDTQKKTEQEAINRLNPPAGKKQLPKAA